MIFIRANNDAQIQHSTCPLTNVQLAKMVRQQKLCYLFPCSDNASDARSMHPTYDGSVVMNKGHRKEVSSDDKRQKTYKPLKF